MTIEAAFFLKKGSFTLDINFKVNKPKITVIYGPSGSGKTTLLRSIAGLEKCDKAKLIVNNNLWQDSEKNFFLPTHLRKIGYISQKNSLFPHLSVKENLLFGYKRTDKADRKIKLTQVTKWLKIQNLLNRHIEDLSGGEVQKVTLARALLNNPEILIMDEPLSAIDSESKKEILDCIKNIKNQFSLPILYVSHLKEETDYLGEEIIFIKK